MYIVNHKKIFIVWITKFELTNVLTFIIVFHDTYCYLFIFWFHDFNLLDPFIPFISLSSKRSPVGPSLDTVTSWFNIYNNFQGKFLMVEGFSLSNSYFLNYIEKLYLMPGYGIQHLKKLSHTFENFTQNRSITAFELKYKFSLIFVLKENHLLISK